MARCICVIAVIMDLGVSALRDSTAVRGKALAARMDEELGEIANMNETGRIEVGTLSNLSMLSVAPARARHDVDKARAKNRNQFQDVSARSDKLLTSAAHASLLGETGLVHGAALISDHNTLQQQLELELPQAITFPLKNKVILSSINMLALGMCGVDRCYMGQPKLGLLKLLTCGGFGVWALLDYIIITINCLQSLESINSAGFQARFNKEEIASSWWITLMIFIAQVVAGLCTPKHRMSAADAEISGRRASARKRAKAGEASSAQDDPEQAFDNFMGTEWPQSPRTEQSPQDQPTDQRSNA